MTEYQKWQTRNRFMGLTDTVDLDPEVQDMLNGIGDAFKRAAQDVGIHLLPDLEGPVGLWEVEGTTGIPLTAKTRKLSTPAAEATHRLDSAPDFYSQFVEEFTYGKEVGLLALSYYYGDVSITGGGRWQIDPKTFEKIDTGVEREPSVHGYSVRFAAVYLRS